MLQATTFTIVQFANLLEKPRHYDLPIISRLQLLPNFWAAVIPLIRILDSRKFLTSHIRNWLSIKGKNTFDIIQEH
jgi:hypothetical protein